MYFSSREKDEGRKDTEIEFAVISLKQIASGIFISDRDEKSFISQSASLDIRI